MLVVEDDTPDLSTRKELWETKEKTVKPLLFELYSRLYHMKSIDEKSIFWQKATDAIESIIWCSQMASLLWTPNLSITGWRENMTIWEIIGYLRFDNICAELGISNEYLYLSILIIFLIFASSAAIFAIICYNSLKLPNFLFDILRWTMNLWVIIFLIPSQTLFFIFLKYNFCHQNFISEYKNNNNFSKFEINVAWQLMIIFAAIIAFPLLLFYTVFSGEIRHTISSKIIKAKAQSKIEVQIAIFTYFSPIIYALMDKDYIIYFQIYMMAIPIIVILEIMKHWPYFSLFCNLTLILRHFILAVISFSFVLGDLMDNSLLIILIAIFLGPFSAWFIIQTALRLQKRSIIAIPASIVEINSEYQLEKSLRHSLCSNETDHKHQIILIFENFFAENSLLRSKFQAIWAANYCLFTLKDESLAAVKLSKTKKISEWNLEADFQEYLCNKNIQNSSLEESTRFISYFQQLNLIKKQDLKLCVNLLNFWNELISTKPDLKRLVKTLNSISKTILFLNSKYNLLTTKFINSRESLELYASYEKNILYEFEKSILLVNKLKSLERNIANFDSKQFSWFNDANGILIFSVEENNFGKILFSNPRAAEILESSLNIIERTNIMNFFPSYYWEKIKEEIEWIIHYGSCSEIDLTKGFFLNLPEINLLECIGKATITSINNNLVLILIFQLRQANRQASLITEFGEILCYSEHFPKFVGKFNDNLIGCNIRNLFPQIEIFESKLFIPYHLPNFKSENILVKSYIQINKLKIFYVLLIADEKEIYNWKHKNSFLPFDIEEEEKNKKSLKFLSTELPSKVDYQRSYEPLISSEVSLNEPSFNEEAPEIIENNSPDKKPQIVQNSTQTKTSKILAASSRSINILHIAFILSILSVLSTNIGVLLYAFSSIDFIENMEHAIFLAEAEDKLQKVAFGTQIMWTLSNYGNNKTALALRVTWASFPYTAAELRNIYLNISSSLPKWDYCSSQSILSEKRIDLWDAGKIKKVNLLELLSQSIQTSYDFIRKYNNSEDTTKEVDFLLTNSYGEAFKYCNSSLYEIMECQKSLSSDFKSVMLILLILGIGVLALCVCVMIPFCCSTVKIENQLWNSLRKRAKENYFEIKQSLLERLRIVHSQPDFFTNNKNSPKNKINFRNYWKFIWRISIYFIVVTLFSIINTTYLYEKCTDYLSYRPEMMKELIGAKILQNSFAVWATEIQFEHLGAPPLHQYLKAYPFSDVKTAFEETISILKDSKKMLRNQKYLPILSKIFKTKFYENDYQISKRYLTYGTSSAEEALINDGYMVAYTRVSVIEWLRWISGVYSLNDNYDELASELDRYSQKVIDSQVNIIVWTFVIFTISSMVIYFSLYLVFFKREKQYLQKIDSMIKIMPK